MEAVRIGGRSHDKANLAVEDVSFEVWAGEKVMLLGPSGCGKSTLLKAIASFIRPDSGVSGWRTVIAASLVFGVAGGGSTFFTNDPGDFLPAPKLLAGLLTIAFAGVLVEATFRLLERGTLIRWGMKVGRE